jgi:integrase
MRLTKRLIDTATYEGVSNSRCVLWDDDPRGLGLRVFPSGRKAFVLSYRVNGLKKLMALGEFGVLTLDTARSRAKQELAKLENTNADPLAEKRSRELESRTGTVEAMVKSYIEQSGAKTAAEMLRQAKKDIIPTFGKRGWRDIRRSEVRAWHQGISAPYAANRALALLRAAYFWRLLQDDDSPEGRTVAGRDTSNPCTGVELNTERPRQTRLEPNELPRLEAAIDAETSDPYMRALFRFVLAVGCRKSEALKLQWTDIEDDGKQARVTFRDTKNSDDRALPLSNYAAKLLRSLPRVDGNPYVFVGRVRGERIKYTSKAWIRIRKAASVERLTLHDLRRSFGSWLAEEGFTSKQIGTTLGHKSDVTSRVYMALGDRSKRDAITAMDRLISKARKPRKQQRKTTSERRHTARILKFPAVNR